MLIRKTKTGKRAGPILLLAMLVCMGILFAKACAADTEYSGSGCMIVYGYFDGQTGSAIFGCPYSKAPKNQIKFQSKTYTFDPISYGGNKYSFRAVTLPAKWTGGTLVLYPKTPNGYNIASFNREIKHSVMLRHFSVTAAGISTYFDLQIPLVKKGKRINLGTSWLTSFMSADLSVKNGKLTVTVFHNRFPLKSGTDYSVSFGPKKSNGRKDVIVKGKYYYSGQKVIGQVKASVVLADEKTGNTGTKVKTYKVGDTFTKNNCTYKILTLSGKKGTVKLIKVNAINGIMEFSDTVKTDGYTFTLKGIDPGVFKI